jgi:hypothetical protein
MFSPTLITAILHAAGRDREIPFEPIAPEHMLKWLRKGATHHTSRVTIPIVGYTQWPNSIELPGLEFSTATDEIAEGRRQFFWGYVPLEELIAYGGSSGDPAAEARSADYELLDFGSRVTPAVMGAGADRGDAEQRCRELLARTTSVEKAECIIGVVDVGVRVPGHHPDDFGGNLSHLTRHDIIFSGHALQVLATLLERLSQNSILEKVHVACALCFPGVEGSSTGPFARGNAPEILSALARLKAFVGSHAKPASINLSMGTHVGPHNGQSPLEEFVGNNWDPMRIIHVSAGNDGGRGLHAVRYVVSGTGEDLVVQTGPGRDDFLLVELWWNSSCGEVSVEIDVLGRDSMRIFSQPASIDSTVPKAFMAPYQPEDPRLTLVSSRCIGAMSTIAFGMTPSDFSDLSDLKISMALDSTRHAPVHAWIAASSNLRTHFSVGTDDATLCVPATARHVVGVAGAISNQRVWANSSRGAADTIIGEQLYSAECRGLYWGAHRAPILAHRVHNSFGAMGTSLASPRACADTAAALLKGFRPTGVEELAAALVGIGFGAKWNNRSGFGIMQM